MKTRKRLRARRGFREGGQALGHPVNNMGIHQDRLFMERHDDHRDDAQLKGQVRRGKQQIVLGEIRHRRE